jgi:hypothetical protein
MKINFKFNPEVLSTKTFQYGLTMLLGVIGAFGAGEIGWRPLAASVAVFVLATCFRDGFITHEKKIVEKENDCK